MLSCEETRDEFSALLDGELDTGRRTAVERHLAECAECLRELGRYQKVSDLYANLEAVHAPEDFEQRVARAIRPKTTPFPLRRAPWRRLVPVLAAAALALIAVTYFAVMPAVHAPGQIQLSKMEAPKVVPAAGLERDKGIAPEGSPAPKRKERAPESEARDQSLPPQPTSTSGEERESGRLSDRNAEAAAPTLDSPAPATRKKSSQEVNVEDAGNDGAAKAKRPEEPAPQVQEKLTAAAAEPRPEQKDEKPSMAPPPSVAAAPAAPAPKPAAAAAASPPSPSAGRSAGVSARGPTGGQDDSTHRWVGGRRFILHAEEWQEESYAGQPAESITRGSDRYQALVRAHPEVAKIGLLKPKVLFSLDNTWYRIEPRGGTSR